MDKWNECSAISVRRHSTSFNGLFHVWASCVSNSSEKAISCCESCHQNTCEQMDKYKFDECSALRRGSAATIHNLTDTKWYFRSIKFDSVIMFSAVLRHTQTHAHHLSEITAIGMTWLDLMCECTRASASMHFDDDDTSLYFAPERGLVMPTLPYSRKTTTSCARNHVEKGPLVEERVWLMIWCYCGLCFACRANHVFSIFRRRQFFNPSSNHKQRQNFRSCHLCRIRIIVTVDPGSWSVTYIINSLEAWPRINSGMKLANGSWNWWCAVTWLWSRCASNAQWRQSGQIERHFRLVNSVFVPRNHTQECAPLFWGHVGQWENTLRYNEPATINVHSGTVGRNNWKQMKMRK